MRATWYKSGKLSAFPLLSVVARRTLPATDKEGENHDETVGDNASASRLLLSHPIVCLLAVLAAGVVLGVLGPIKVVHATDVAQVEAENFDNKPTGTSIVTNTTLYQNGQALRFNNNTAIAWEDVDFTSSTSSHDVVLVARAGQSGGGGGGSLTYIGSATGNTGKTPQVKAFRYLQAQSRVILCLLFFRPIMVIWVELFLQAGN